MTARPDRPQIRVRIAAPAGGGKSTLARMIGELCADHEIPFTLPPRMKRRDPGTHEQCVAALKTRGTIIVISETDSPEHEE